MNVWAYISAGVGWGAGGGVGDEHVALLRYSAKVARDRVDVRLSRFSSPFRSCTGGVTLRVRRYAPLPAAMWSRVIFEFWSRGVLKYCVRPVSAAAPPANPLPGRPPHLAGGTKSSKLRCKFHDPWHRPLRLLGRSLCAMGQRQPRGAPLLGRAAPHTRGARAGCARGPGAPPARNSPRSAPADGRLQICHAHIVATWPHCRDMATLSRHGHTATTWPRSGDMATCPPGDDPWPVHPAHFGRCTDELTKNNAASRCSGSNQSRTWTWRKPAQAT